MKPDSEALRAILKQYVGAAYDRALRNTGEEAVAKEATRRAMEVLKKACEEGVEPNKALVLRITDDCCNQSAFFNKQAEPSQAPAPAEPAAPAFRSPVAVQDAAIRPTPAREAAVLAARQPRFARDMAPEGLSAPLAPAGTPAKAKARGVSPGSALLVMVLSLVVVILIILLVVMLTTRGALPDTESGIAADFSTWFNAHIFPLF